MKLSSSAFNNGGTIPERFGRDYDNINPPLLIEEVPSDAVSLVLFMYDPDVPPAAGVPVWDHWVVFNIPADIRIIHEGWKTTGVRGQGTRGELDYGGPRPPDREHRYFFRVYALDAMLDLPEGSNKQQVSNAVNGHVLETAELMGRYAPPLDK
ncbi:TPA: YbhB/YbcL family Raf kinase inhibitor-like protein [Candidatus Uhrbacteria bacterium]|nr:YbhB/YbcL family Raf kinase inhibitor-like protein [Candidatus Uhrbacteria bacterium]